MDLGAWLWHNDVFKLFFCNSLVWREKIVFWLFFTTRSTTARARAINVLTTQKQVHKKIIVHAWTHSVIVVPWYKCILKRRLYTLRVKYFISSSKWTYDGKSGRRRDHVITDVNTRVSGGRFEIIWYRDRGKRALDLLTVVFAFNYCLGSEQNKWPVHNKSYDGDDEFRSHVLWSSAYFGTSKATE